MSPVRNLAAVFLLLFVSIAAPTARAQDPSMVVHLLDYIAVDYAEAVLDGKVRNADEYKEMTDFAANVAEGIAKLADAPQKASLAQRAESLKEMVAAKASPTAVSAAASALRQSLVVAYKVAIGPRRAPDLGRAATLYSQHCASCHGATGLGDGPVAKGMDPAPANFHEAERQHQRSIHGLYNTLSLGVGGTPMRGFQELSDADRWALAYYAASWGAPDEEVARGRRLWESGAFKDRFSAQASIAGSSANEVRAQGGNDAAAVLAYLRRNPALLDQGKASPLDFTREKLAESLALHKQGQRDAAVQASLTAYLDGFEMVEASLATVDEPLMRRIESSMIGYRNLLKSGAPVPEVEAMGRRIDDALVDAQSALSSGGLSPAASFLASFIILFREGLEAVLVIAALLAFLRRSGQAHAIPFLHLGWTLALFAGGLTWFAANRLIQVSGAHREVTEGLSALVASAMLLYVGFWLHGKSNAQAWQGFLMQGAKAIRPGAAWGLAFMAFLAVYREIFETILFYEALWAQAPEQSSAIVAGLLAAAVALGALTWAMLRFSLRLPLGLFFGASALLLAALSVILAGNGVSALQEAGWLAVTPVAFPTISWLGIHPSLQALGTQVVLVAVILGLWRHSRHPSGG
ncbi:hypothetical protein BWI17_16145 [Betaproteobacteria bacterium GR16-43]|nr:hypothetical protein BWI17_16145 [Betaproteobacteria bacterium GR16-43]